MSKKDNQKLNDEIKPITQYRDFYTSGKRVSLQIVAHNPVDLINILIFAFLGITVFYSMEFN